MNLFFRRSILLLLLMLQGITPLVHAHVVAGGGESGLHIAGISVQADTDSYFSSIKSVGHADVFISMPEAIQQKNLLLIKSVSVAFSEIITDLLPVLSFVEKRVIFFTHSSTSNSVVNHSSVTPRAPPF